MGTCLLQDFDNTSLPKRTDLYVEGKRKTRIGELRLKQGFPGLQACLFGTPEVKVCVLCYLYLACSPLPEPLEKSCDQTQHNHAGLSHRNSLRVWNCMQLLAKPLNRESWNLEDDLQIGYNGNVCTLCRLQILAHTPIMAWTDECPWSL